MLTAYRLAFLLIPLATAAAVVGFLAHTLAGLSGMGVQ